MEKELTTNEVKHVKYEESKTYQIYDTVKYNGYKWIVINVRNNKLTLMMKNCLPKEKMKEIFNNDYLVDFDYIKYKVTKIYKIYYLIKYNCYKWIVINVKDNKLTLMMKNCLPKKKMKEIFNNDYLDEDGDIKYNFEVRCIGWNKTEIRRGLNNKFLKEFNKEELVKMITDYAFE